MWRLQLPLYPPLPPSHHRLFVHMVVDGCGVWACVRVCRRLPLPVPSSLGPDQGELRQRGVDSAIVAEATEECVLVSAERMECVCVWEEGGEGCGTCAVCLKTSLAFMSSTAQPPSS